MNRELVVVHYAGAIAIGGVSGWLFGSGAILVGAVVWFIGGFAAQLWMTRLMFQGDMGAPDNLPSARSLGLRWLLVAIVADLVAALAAGLA